jgi:aspartate/methionine/tyrosine aminotransferase
MERFFTSRQEVIMRSRNLAAHRWAQFGKNIFSEMSELAKEAGAVNLAQGFPDERGPERVLMALKKQLEQGTHQYAPYIGEPRMREAVAAHMGAFGGLEYNPDTEITITTGATEAIYSAINAFVNPGDRVLIFDPSFDTYAQAVANAGGVLVPVQLHAPDTPLGLRWGGWAVDWEEFSLAAKEGFSLLILNSPHNPTAKVFAREELLRIAEEVQKQNAIVLSDEVYEHVVFDDSEHISLATFPGMRERVVRVSSVAKTFGFTGFKLGWVCAVPELTATIRLVHQAVVFCTPSHIQLAFAEILLDDDWTRDWVQAQKAELASRRTLLSDSLARAGFRVEPTRGTYFLLANYDELSTCSNAMRFCRDLVARRKVACIPVSAFSLKLSQENFWLRFAFCKSRDSIARAGKLLCCGEVGSSVSE